MSTTELEEIVTEKELNESLHSLFDIYNNVFLTIKKEYERLEKYHDNFPETFVSNADFEDFLIKASICKHKSITLLKNTVGVYGRLENDLDHYESLIRIHLSTDFLKSKGFDKITDALRDGFLSSNKYIKKLRGLKKELKSYEKPSEYLIRSYSDTEINFRKFVDMKNKLKGLA